MRVLVFQGYVDPAGRTPEVLLDAWPSLPAMAEALVRGGAEVQVVVAARHDAGLERAGVRYRFVDEGRGRGFRRHIGARAAPHPRRALAAARRIPADAIHLHGLSFPRQARALRRRDTVLLGQDHADLPVSGWRRPLHARGLAALDGVAFTHRAQAEPFLRAGLLAPEQKVFEVVEGSTDFAPGPREEARARTGLEGAPGLLWVGNLAAGKDPWTVLDAVAATSGALPRLRLWMIHRAGALTGAVRRRLEDDPALTGRVRLVGPVDHARVEEWLRAADLFVGASHREGSGYALIESMACGTPAVTTDLPPHRAIVGDSPAGVLYPVGDAAALAEALVATAPRVRRLRASARDRFDAALSWDRIAERLLAAYGALREARAPSGGGA